MATPRLLNNPTLGFSPQDNHPHIYDGQLIDALIDLVDRRRSKRSTPIGGRCNCQSSTCKHPVGACRRASVSQIELHGLSSNLCDACFTHNIQILDELGGVA